MRRPKFRRMSFLNFQSYYTGPWTIHLKGGDGWWGLYHLTTRGEVGRFQTLQQAKDYALNYSDDDSGFAIRGEGA
jgi:hypothetical protein